MSKKLAKAAASLCIGAAMTLAGPVPANAAPKRGDVLKFVVPDEPPSFDGHKETTFALIHPIAPFYSVLIRVDPDNPATLTSYVCDLCTDMPSATDDGTSYTFKIRKGVDLPRWKQTVGAGRPCVLPAHHLSASGRI